MRCGYYCKKLYSKGHLGEGGRLHLRYSWIFRDTIWDMVSSRPEFHLNTRERGIFRKLNTPQKIQDFLERIPINFEPHGDTLLSPRRVLKEKKAHCMEGALFAAAVLWFHGEEPFLLDLKAARPDFDHVVALFRRHGRWGAISKTNHTILRYRDPVYRTVRELAMSYFNEYIYDDGRKTMRSYSRPFSMKRFGTSWVTAKDDLWEVDAELDASPHYGILTPGSRRSLRPGDTIERRALGLTDWPKKR